MSINGQTIQNEAISLFVDLEGPTHAPGAHIILYHLNKTGGTRNQNWRFIPVNAGKNLFTIQSVLTGGYASVDSPAADQAVKHCLTSTPWEVVVVGYSSADFIIRLPNTSLVWTVTGEHVRFQPGSIIRIAQAADNDTRQHWKIADI